MSTKFKSFLPQGQREAPNVHNMIKRSQASNDLLHEWSHENLGTLPAGAGDKEGAGPTKVNNISGHRPFQRYHMRGVG